MNSSITHPKLDRLIEIVVDRADTALVPIHVEDEKLHFVMEVVLVRKYWAISFRCNHCAAHHLVWISKLDPSLF